MGRLNLIRSAIRAFDSTRESGLLGQGLIPILRAGGSDSEAREPPVPEDILNRPLLNDLAEQIIAEFNANKQADVPRLMTRVAGVQEAERKIRDYKIVTAGHKELMLDCLETLARRLQKEADDISKDATD